MDLFSGGVSPECPLTRYQRSKPWPACLPSVSQPYGQKWTCLAWRQTRTDFDDWQPPSPCQLTTDDLCLTFVSSWSSACWRIGHLSKHAGQCWLLSGQMWGSRVWFSISAKLWMSRQKRVKDNARVNVVLNQCFYILLCLFSWTWIDAGYDGWDFFCMYGHCINSSTSSKTWKRHSWVFDV